jgi:hypothetical protein
MIQQAWVEGGVHTYGTSASYFVLEHASRIIQRHKGQAPRKLVVLICKRLVRKGSDSALRRADSITRRLTQRWA